MPGQTIEDIARAEAVFLEKVIALHPEADGKPCVIGNCQAGWAVMMLAALRPELFGPIIIAGSPLSYWAGVRGKYPMRYSGGLLGGSWLTALASDLGHGKFDGAWLVQNFENQNPANTLWTKQYNLYSKIDTEAARYLGFERWWGGHVNLNAEEIQFIVDELFVGNNLASRQHQDLRRHRDRSSQHPLADRGVLLEGRQHHAAAAGARLDPRPLRRRRRDPLLRPDHRLHHPRDVGHLGIFVSSGVARKEHGEFSSNIDLIDTLPPGLYEAMFTQTTTDDANPDLVSGDWVMRCEARTLDDIRALGGNDAADERRFATAARVSETNLALYRTFVQPFVRAWSIRRWRNGMPQCIRCGCNTRCSPMPIRSWRRSRRRRSRCGAERKPVAADNPFLAMQESHVASRSSPRSTPGAMRPRRWPSAPSWRSTARRRCRRAVGIDPESDERPLRKAAKSPLHQQLRRAADRRAEVAHGRRVGCAKRWFAPRSMSAWRGGSVDERGFEVVRRIRLADERYRAADAGAIQGARARAILHAADR